MKSLTKAEEQVMQALWKLEKGFLREITDAIVMNLDDLLCIGIYDQLLFSSTIDRNKKLIPGEVLKEVIEGTQEFFDTMRSFGVNISFMGGETADVGDVVRTIAVNGTLTARWPKTKLVTNEKIRAGNVIVGLAGYGVANYETSYNSGIASNGLTSARHDLLNKLYAEKYPESFEPSLDKDVVYIGPHKMTDSVTNENGDTVTAGQLLLSPTRTFAPVVKTILTEYFDAVYGMIHCSGGGQTKCMKYVPDNVKIVKDNLLDIPVVFDLIQKASGADDKEMYQVFNMGTRLEIYTDEKNAANIVAASKSLGVDAQVIGRVEEADGKQLEIKTKSGLLNF